MKGTFTLVTCISLAAVFTFTESNSVKKYALLMPNVRPYRVNTRNNLRDKLRIFIVRVILKCEICYTVHIIYKYIDIAHVLYRKNCIYVLLLK